MIITFPDSLMQISSLTFQLKAYSASTPQSAFNSLALVSGPTVELWSVSMTVAPLGVCIWESER